MNKSIETYLTSKGWKYSPHFDDWRNFKKPYMKIQLKDGMMHLTEVKTADDLKGLVKILGE